MEFIDLNRQYKELESRIDQRIKKVLNEGNYILGPEVYELEEKLAAYVGTKYCITCANGTDALLLVLKALGLGKGDAVFVPTFTFYATAEVVSDCGATPIFVDIDSKTFNIDPIKLKASIDWVKKHTDLIPKMVIPVDLFGQAAQYDQIQKIADEDNIFVLEDAAQGFGGSFNGKVCGSFGHAATTSFFPAKPLGCYGDGGAIFTNDEELRDILVSLRVHGKGGHKYDNVRVGMNSRLDTIQAAILLEKLAAFMNYELDSRCRVSQKYKELLGDFFTTPFVADKMTSSWAQYTLILNSKEEREFYQKKLLELDIPTAIYYPIPLHKQTVYKDNLLTDIDLSVSEDLSNKVLSLPFHPYLENADIENICSVLISAKSEL